MDIRKHMRDVERIEDINKSLFVVMLDSMLFNNEIDFRFELVLFAIFVNG